MSCTKNGWLKLAQPRDLTTYVGPCGLLALFAQQTTAIGSKIEAQKGVTPYVHIASNN